MPYLSGIGLGNGVRECGERMLRDATAVQELMNCDVAGGSDKSLCLWHAETGA